MEHTPDNIPVTLENIAQQKSALLLQIRTRKKNMTNLAQNLLSPLAPTTNKAGAAMRAFNTGMAVFDGTLLGLKLMRKVRGFFSKKK